MGILEEIRDMQRAGKSEEEIIEALRARRVPENKIEDALAQMRIKSEIMGEEAQEPSIPLPPQAEESMSLSPSTQEVEAPAPEQQYSPYPPEAAQEQPQEAVYAESPQGYAPQQQKYQQYQYSQYAPQQAQPQLSSDTISEIAEQVVSEKLASIKDKLEKTIDLKTTLEAKTESLNERLKRIEQIIDRLQLSILQRVGAYMAEVDNVKKELVETQKSFKAIPQKKSQQPQQKQFEKSQQQ